MIYINIIEINGHRRQLNSIHNKTLELFGKASFNIFLVQMIYYLVASKFLYPRIENVIVILIINLLVCLSVGVIFYKIETPITQKVIKLIKR